MGNIWPCGPVLRAAVAGRVTGSDMRYHVRRGKGDNDQGYVGNRAQGFHLKRSIKVIFKNLAKQRLAQIEELQGLPALISKTE